MGTVNVNLIIRSERGYKHTVFDNSKKKQIYVSKKGKIILTNVNLYFINPLGTVPTVAEN